MLYDDRDLPSFEAVVNRSFSKPIGECFFTDGHLAEYCQWFDKEGFELTDLEGIYAAVNSFPLTKKAFGHKTIGWHWIENCNISHPDIYVDHSYIMFRPEFTGAAREQLERHVKRYPFLTKLLKIKSKVGLDMALEYVTEPLTTEVVHIEIDEKDFIKAWVQIRKIQSGIKHKEWDAVVSTIQILQPHIEQLPSDDQSDLKARLFGFARTYQTLKTV